MNVNTLLIVASVVILICILLYKVSSKIGIPTLLFFLFFGIFFTHPSGLGVDFKDFKLAEEISSFCLVFVMFYGGFGTRWKEAKSVAKQAIILSTGGVVLTAGLVTIFCHYILGFGIFESFILGSVISSTDAASVFSIIRSKRLSLKYKTASLLELESGSNDSAAFILTTIGIGLLNGTITSEYVALIITKEVLFGLSMGYLHYKVSRFMLKRVSINDGLDTVLIFSITVLTYATTTFIHGNGYLAVYILGILLGNSYLKNKVQLVHFFDAFTNLMEILLFFGLGLLSNPDKILQYLPYSLVIFVFLTLIGRVVSVEVLMYKFKLKRNQKLLISSAGLRGAASIVFAIIATNDVVVANTLDIFHITFGVVLLSILIQGSLLPILSKKLDMADPMEDPFKSFNDYAKDIPIDFISFKITGNHRWKNKRMKDIDIGSDFLVVCIKRGKDRIIPSGSTLIFKEDELICVAKSYLGGTDIRINEITVGEDYKHINQPLKQVEDDFLIVFINRGEEYIIPNGDEIIQLNDNLIYFDKKELIV